MNSEGDRDDVDSYGDDRDDVDSYGEMGDLDSYGHDFYSDDEDVDSIMDGNIDESDESYNLKKWSYTVLSNDDIRHREEEDIATISSVLSISRDSATILLVHYNWNVNNLHDAWFANEEKVRSTVGLVEENDQMQIISGKKLSCGICFENYSLEETLSAACGHFFCKSCWKCYLTTSVNDGPGCLMLRCPEPTCGAGVSQDIVNLLVEDKEKEKYLCYLLRSYVEVKPNIKWCPAPGCDNAVEFAVGSESYDISCKCTYTFCWNCTEDAHRPLDCDTVAKWIFKSTDESENVNWILANSKPCPKCQRPIEKNEGCMHMTCKDPCKHQFCWLCLRSYREHGTCNGFDTGISTTKDEEEDKRKMAKHSLDRYAHYYERWAANQYSRKQAMTDLQKARAVHIEELRNKHCELESQVQFIAEAWQQIIECRRVLKWTYAYGYYLPEDEHAKRRLFEYLQGHAESALERLHHCAEKDMQRFLTAEGTSDGFSEFRSKLAGLTSVTGKFFENLLQALENGLADVSTCGQEDDSGLWSCAFCKYSSNSKYSSICQRCNNNRVRTRKFTGLNR